METVIYIHGDDDTKMKIVILGGRNHWISFKLLSIFFSVVVLTSPKHKKRDNIYRYIYQTRLHSRDETVSTKTWESSPSAPPFPQYSGILSLFKGRKTQNTPIS